MAVRAGDGRIARVELQSGMAEKFDIALEDDVCVARSPAPNRAVRGRDCWPMRGRSTALVARYNSSAPGETPAFDFSSFVAMYDGTFSQYIASSIGAKAAASESGISNA